MRYLLIIPAIIFLLAVAVTACNSSNSGNGNNVVEEADSTSVLRLSPEEQRVKDSLDSIAALPPSVLRNDVTTPEQADSFMRQSGYWAEYSSGVMDTIAKQNIDYANRLLHNREPYFLVADKQHMMVVLYNKYGQPHRAYKMACSAQFGTKHARRDNRIPEGFFSAEGIYDSTEWLFTDDDGNTSEKRGQFGPRWFRGYMLKIADNQIIILVCMSSFTHHSYRNFNVLQYSEILCTAKVVIFPQYPMHHYVKNTFHSHDYPQGTVFGGNQVQDAWQRIKSASTHS